MPPVTLFERLVSRGIQLPTPAATASVQSPACLKSVQVAPTMPIAPAPVATAAVVIQVSLNAAGKDKHESKEKDKPREKQRKRKLQALTPPSTLEEHARSPPVQIKLTKWLRQSDPKEPRSPATPQHRDSLVEEHAESCAQEASPQLVCPDATATCAICCDDICASKAVRLRCQHGLYCLQCMSRHVEARLDLGLVQQTCPECNVELPERDLKRMVPQELMDRILARSLEQAVATEENLRPCPTPNCPMRVALEADDSGEFGCTVCGKDCCLRCGAQPYHKGKTCEQFAARKKKTRRCSLAKWIKETGSKQCPSCSMVVTKQNLKCQATQRSECHKMMCRNCGTRFCFKCLAVLTEHFTCGCTKDAHGFLDPQTGKHVAHLKVKTQKTNSRGKQAWRDRAGGA